ncbi:MAG: Fe-S cluster assembly sulfur transfer protein SufU [Thermomicrobiales bacterium]
MTDSIYREVILDHYKNPRNRGRLDPADHSHSDVNPLCGDEIRLDLRVTDGIITEVAFEGRGCAISQAATSILTELVAGQSVEDAKRLGKADILEELGVPISPARMKCALLGLKCLKAGLYGVSHIHDDDL